MYEIGSKVLDNKGRVFEIEKIEDKDMGSGLIPYYVLKPYFEYNLNPGYRTYIPVDKTDELLSPILSKDEAYLVIDSIPLLDTYDDVSPRNRKNYFAQILSKGGRETGLKVIKTLLIYREERAKLKKPFSDFDRRLLEDLVSSLHNELSLSLEVNPDEVADVIYERIGYRI